MGKTLQKQKRSRRDGKNTQKDYTKNILNDPDNHDGVVSDSEPDIVECEVKQTLGSTAVNKASGCDGIPVELFKALKDDAIKIWKNPSVATGLEKVSPHPNSQEGQD